MGFPEKAAMSFAHAVKSLKVDIDELVEQKADINNAQATVEDDLIMIHEKISKSLGHMLGDRITCGAAEHRMQRVVAHIILIDTNWPMHLAQLPLPV